MPDLKISQLPVATTPLAGTELVPLVQGGVTVQSTVDKVLTGTVPSGTANGVPYLNASKVLTTGSALTFDGTNFGADTVNNTEFYVGAGQGTPILTLYGTAAATPIVGYRGSGGLRFGTVTGGGGAGFSEQMRLTSTGLGIGTTSPSVASGLGIVVNGGAGQARIALKNTNSGDTSTDGFQLAIDTSSNAYIDQRENAALIFNTNNTERARIPAAGGMVVGTAALATTATDGFLYVPTCAGTPTGTPTTQTGTAPIVVDTTNNKLYFYSGGQWRDAGP